MDLPATVGHLDEGASPGGSLPEGAWEALSYLGTAGYAGPCPPPGAAALGTATLVGSYGR